MCADAVICCLGEEAPVYFSSFRMTLNSIICSNDSYGETLGPMRLFEVMKGQGLFSDACNNTSLNS